MRNVMHGSLNIIGITIAILGLYSSFKQIIDKWWLINLFKVNIALEKAIKIINRIILPI